MKQYKNIVIITVLIFLIVLSDDYLLSQKGENKDKTDIKFTEEDPVYINSLEELKAIPGFEDVKFRLLKSNIKAGEEDSGKVTVSVNILEIEKKGKPVLHIANQESNVSDWTSPSRIFAVQDYSDNSSLSCMYVLNEQEDPFMMMLGQEGPTAVIRIEKHERWKNLLYTTNKEVNRYDSYHDIDFDGSFDVRFITNKDLQKIAECYIMLDLDWVKADRAFPSDDPPVAFRTLNKKEIRYEFTYDQGWVKKESAPK